MISAGLGRLPTSTSGAGAGVSCTISMHSSMHSSQINTPGPATMRFTSFCFLPQKEQRTVMSLSFFGIFHLIALLVQRRGGMTSSTMPYSFASAALM